MTSVEAGDRQDDLAFRFLHGSEEALKELLTVHGAVVEQALKVRFGSRLVDADIQDVLSIALYKSWKARNRFDPGKGSLRTWFYLIARNTALDLLRQRQRSPVQTVPNEDLDFLYEEIASSGSTAGTGQSKVRTRLQEIIRSLPKDDQAILYATAMGGPGAKELSQYLHTSPGNVRVRRNRLLKKIRKLLKEGGG